MGEVKKRCSHFRSTQHLTDFTVSTISQKKSILPSPTLVLLDLASESCDTSAAAKERERTLAFTGSSKLSCRAILLFPSSIRLDFSLPLDLLSLFSNSPFHTKNRENPNKNFFSLDSPSPLILFEARNEFRFVKDTFRHERKRREEERQDA